MPGSEIPRYWPLGAGRIVTSPFGPRSGGFHAGVDFGRNGGSAGMPVYAVQSGTVIYAGAAQGYGGPDPAGWLVIDSTDAEGSGCLEYGHIVREVSKGQHVSAGQRIGHINPDTRTNGGTPSNPIAPHLHLSDMPREYNPGAKQDPMKRLAGAREPEAAPPAPSTGGNATVALADPITKALWTARNRYSPRGLPSPMWIGCHTSESRSRAVNLRDYCERNEVSYHRIVDDVDIVGMVRDTDGSWSAVGANKYAYHICWSSSFASWSREQWLDPTPGDGFNERNALRLGAKQIAYWIQQSRAAGRPIPVEWIGGRNRPPWGLNGICGHVDFGTWGGGHSDPGPNFPVDTLLSDVREFLTGEPQPPIVAPPPVGVPGTNPDKYADWMLYQGNPRNNVDRVRAVQRRLKYAYAAYAGHLAIDGDFGPLTRMAVEEFQRRSKPLVVDGIVGPMTAAALKP
ncbi:lysin A [Mycobacterium phage 32HC]|uniref:Lysin A n=1 Tax=Mycobacterium phage 32HC TaxID=1445729 RepID=W8E8S7_9CAUD|nr:endolysin [Mycobacterium phage 32HC]AHJ86314.1 lysin A [Mycobacterium phage 32HC]